MKAKPKRKSKKEKTLTFLIDAEGNLLFPEVDAEFASVLETLSSAHPEVKLVKEILHRPHFGPHMLCG